MSAHSDHATKVADAIASIKDRAFPGTLNLLSLALIAWGLVAVGYGLFVGTPTWTAGAVLTAVFWSLCLAQGGVMFAVIAQGTRARWSRTLKRIGESFFFFLPVAIGLLAVFFLAGGLSIYAWSPSYALGEPVALAPHMKGALPAKEFWLQDGFFVVRNLGILVVLMGLDWVFVRNSLRPDMLLAKETLGASAPGWWSWVIGSATDVKAAVAKAERGNNNLVPLMAMGYAVIWSLLAFDLIMSLDPWWFSNMFGGWIFMSSILLAMGGIALVATLGRDWLGLGAFVTKVHTHDLGKLMLAGTMFWAYTLYAQILPIYYTDVPEETGFLLVRMVLPQWQWLAKVVAVLCFIAPFTILLSRGVKKMRYPFVGVAAVSMTGLFMERTLLVMPAAHLGDTFPWFDFLFVSLGVWAGVIGLMIAVVGRVLNTLPVVPVSDPLLEDHPWDVHVHAAGPAASSASTAH